MFYKIIFKNWRDGRVAEGVGLLNRYMVEKLYRGFESPSLRHTFKTTAKAVVLKVWQRKRGDENTRRGSTILVIFVNERSEFTKILKIATRPKIKSLGE